MIGRRSPLLAISLLCGALLAGCGSASSPTTTSGSTASTAASTAATTASAPSTQASTATTSASPASTQNAPPGGTAAVAQYEAICKEVIARAPTLGAEVKSKVEGICTKAAHGDVAGARAAAKEVCVEVINASPIPSTAKEKALAACKAT
jgi:hypothetical protein